MTAYHFAIDETGSFNLDKNDRSFVCGILVSKDEKALQKHYIKAFEKCNFGETVPTAVAELLGDGKFHFFGLSEENKQNCREILLPLVDKAFVSTGKPLFMANNQDFWLRAVVSVIFKLFAEYKFQKGDKLNIEIDHRADMVWGLMDDGVDFNKYHSIIKKQIDKFIEPYWTGLGITVSLKFVGDTKSFFVNLADIVCGFSRTQPAIEKIECPCENVMSGDNPIYIMDKNPVGALSVIFSEILSEKFENTKFIPNIIKKAKSYGNDDYIRVWELFHHFLQYCVYNRYSSRHMNSKLNDTVNIFRDEFKCNSDKIAVDDRLEIIGPLMAYYSHRGEICAPVARDAFVELLNKNIGKIEGRVTRKWERYVGFCLREAQFQYNAYNFSQAVKEWEEICGKQDKILKIGYPFDAQKDEHTTAIIGTLAQSYAYDNQIDKAIKYFEKSKSYAIKTSAQTDSYLLTLYFIKQDIKTVRKYFESQTNKTPENFKNRDRSEDGYVWELLSYSKLRALELYKNHKTDLPEIPVTAADKKSPYPWPLVLKWSAAAKYLENPAEKKQAASDYLSNAVKNLLGGNVFTMKTLALPIIQMSELIDDVNPYHVKYDHILDDLKKQSPYFADYVKTRAPLLDQLKNEADIWERATLLPFNYS